MKRTAATATKSIESAESPRVVAYVAAATEDARARQRRGIEQFAARQSLEIVEWHEDTATSTTPLEERQGIIAALAALSRHSATALLVHARDDLSRAPLAVAAIEAIVQHKRAAIMTATTRASQMEIEDARTGEAARMFGLVISFVERARGVSGRLAKAELRRQGKRSSGLLPYGCRLDASGNVVRDPKEWRVVQFARAQHEKGHSFTRIAEMCTEKGFLSRAGTPFFGAQISRMVGSKGTMRGRTIMSTTEKTPKILGEKTKKSRRAEVQTNAA